MAQDTSIPCPDDSVDTEYIDPVVALLLPKPRMTLGQHFAQNTDKIRDRGCCSRIDNTCCSIISRWWNVRFKCQRRLVSFFEQPLFHIIITTLVIIDCLLTIAAFILDFISIKKSCESKSVSHTGGHHREDESDRIEHAAEVIEYCSMALLTLFVLEVLIKTFVFGRHWWNFKEKKLEWMDAIVVIATFCIGLASIHRHDLFTGIPVLFIALRLWRIVSCYENPKFIPIFHFLLD